LLPASSTSSGFMGETPLCQAAETLLYGLKAPIGAAQAQCSKP
jgi:hypothetical protein